MVPSRGIALKSTRELTLMREAGRVNALALEAAKAVIQAGVTTADIDAAASIFDHEDGKAGPLCILG